MIRDFSERQPEGRYDFCIVGAGPAGITLALKLAGARRRVLLLEGGGSEFSPESQELYSGVITGDDYFPLEVSRLRFLGGSSNHWGGWSRPLDAVDFEPKPAFPMAHWPIRKSNLNPYTEEAKAILGIDELPPDVSLNKFVKEIGFEFAPVRFGEKYSTHLRQSREIDLYLNANVTRLKTDGRRVSGVECTSWSGRKYDVPADTYVLATGGIENSRLLLWSDERANGALLAASTPIGRYWMEHPHFTIGQVVLFEDDPFRAGVGGQSFLSPTREALMRDESLNCGLRLVRMSYRGTEALIADLACVAPELAERAAQLLGKHLRCGMTLRAAWEQEPQASSRIELTDEMDPLGVPRVQLNWLKSENDIRTARKAAERLGQYLAENDIGRVHLDDWVLESNDFPATGEIGGNHHMGGTRMASSHEIGVVDENCRVFGQQNLYVAGSSVFPTGGHANPTFTVLQLSLRLGEHLLRSSTTSHA